MNSTILPTIHVTISECDKDDINTIPVLVFYKVAYSLVQWKQRVANTRSDQSIPLLIN